MRVTYRNSSNKDYWNKRWTSIPADNSMNNLNAYPLKYAEMIIQENDGPILEAGCGMGRILRYYHERDYDIVGIDFVDIAIAKLKEIDPTLRVEIGNITKLRFQDGQFKYVLAFGLYHNLENELENAIAETYRILQNGGWVCASFRADNLQTRLTDWLADRRNKSQRDNKPLFFHKMNLSRNELSSLFIRFGFLVENIYPVENMPILYKFPFFRAKAHNVFDESKARQEGYRLSKLGRAIQNFLMRFFPDQFCNLYVIIARKIS